MNSEDPTNDRLPEGAVAIIGMACRLPGAPDTTTFWQNLLEGRESITEFTDDELRASGVDPALIRSPNYVKARGIIGGADEFDASFFSFTPREAELLDPQHRVFLECAWHAMEDAGYPPGTTEDRVAVFGGVGTNWHLAQVSDLPEVKKHSSAASVVTGNDKDYVTTRVSYKLGLTGPSVNVQCACSTSMVAALLGLNALRTYQCDLALAGGATVEIPERKGYLYQEGGMEAPDGHCRPFDARARGTVFSRGCSMVLLKRLEDAVRDGDHIYAVLLDGAVNNDGDVKAGFTAPSVTGQVEAGIEALERAGVSGDDITFVEAHGTATALGDPIEVASLTQIFNEYTARKQFCALGSVKGNIGHTDVAAGTTALIKASLALRNRELPASVNFETPNPAIDFPQTAFFVNTERRRLERNGRPLRALVNAFGVGGTNATVVLEEPPVREVGDQERSQNVYLLSARSPEALDAATSRLAAHLDAHPDARPDDVAFTTQVGRRSFSHRRYVVASGLADLKEKLSDPGRLTQHVVEKNDENPAVVLGFPGQGNQFLYMGKDLYDAEPVFRAAVDECSELLAPTLGLDLRQILYPSADERDEARKRLDETDVTQPAIFVISYAMARQWMAWGVRPAAFVGHSVGEYVAATLAGVFSLADALQAVAVRGKLIQALPRGSMLAVLLPEADVVPLLPDDISVAAVNGPQLTVVSGPSPSIESLRASLEARGIFAKELDTSHAFHSAMMDPALPEFSQVMSGISLSPPRVPIVSTVTGHVLDADQATDSTYWVTHMREPVRFHAAAEAIFAEAERHILLECGPGRSLSSAAKRVLKPGMPHDALASMAGAEGEGSDLTAALEALGGLWARGVTPEWSGLYDEVRPGRVPLPGYPFQRQRFALDVVSRASLSGQSEAGIDDSKKPDIGDWFYVPTWARSAAPELLPSEGSRDGAPEEEHWLVFEDAHGISEALLDELAQAGRSVVVVVRGDSFARNGDLFTVRPDSAEDHHSLVAALKAEGRLPNRVLHLWNVDDALGRTDLDDLTTREALAFYSPLFIEQALVKSGGNDGLRLLIGVTGTVDVAGEGITDPGGALALGPSRALSKENPRSRARCVDIEIPAKRPERTRLARRLIAETVHSRDEYLVAYRGGHRWIESHEAVYLEPSRRFEESIRPGGVYLITGGLGGLGLFVAQRMAEVAPCTLALVSRSGLPPREVWADWLYEHANNDPTSERIRAVQRIEAAGGTVVWPTADAGDLASMQSAVAQVEEAHGPITGVIHAAGLPGGGIISLKTVEMAAEVLRPKVRGTMVLDSIFRDRPLDFFVFFSSITSLLGEAGRVDYCSANAFMDAVAQQAALGSSEDRSAASPVSIGWPSWASFGMAARWEETKSQQLRALTRQDRGEDGRFLRRVEGGGEEEIYDVLIDPDTDWVITEHMVFDVPTLVGASFFQFLLEYGAIQRPSAAVVVENSMFLSPVMFRANEARRLRLFVRHADRGRRFSFRSQRLSRDGSEGPWQEHFRGRLSFAESGAADRADVTAILTRMDEEVQDPSFRLPLEEGVIPYLRLSRRWDTLTALHLGRDEWLAKLRVPEEFTSDREEWAIHPSMLDVSLAAATWRVVSSPYLPTGYDRVTLQGPLPEEMWSHIRLRDFSGDTVSFDVTLYDADGRRAAEIEGYTLRKVNEDSAGAAPASPAEGEAGLDDDSTDILPDEGWDAFSRIMSVDALPHVIVSTRDLQGLIDEDNETADPEKSAKRKQDESSTRSKTYARPALSTPYEPPANAIEEAIAEVWQGVLGIGDVGVNDDFSELGGNSLLAVQTVANIADAMDVDLPIDAFLAKPTVRGIAETVVDLLVSMASEDELEQLISTLDD